MSRPSHFTRSATFNSSRSPSPRRRTPPRSFSSQNPHPISIAPHTAPPIRSARFDDKFLLHVTVLVDEATEPGISDSAAATKRRQLIDIVHGRSTHSPHASGGQAVAFALRKRLKSTDDDAVLNTLTLLDELMRTCPYFYRYVANEKFFRRMWRFVVPDYKNGVKGMIPLFNKGRVHAGMRPDSEASTRVRILIRAWAEELATIYSGRYDPDAGFLIERYQNKKSRFHFPEVPQTSTPWICRVNRESEGGGSGRRATGNDDAIQYSLAEVENTVTLFASMVEGAESVADLKGDLLTDMAARCQEIKANMGRMGMNMSKEDEMARAIAVSETLERVLAQYRNSLDSNQLVRVAPVVDNVSLQSDDEGYDDGDRDISDRSLDRWDERGRSLSREGSSGHMRYRPSDRPVRRGSASDVASGRREDDEWRSNDREQQREQGRSREKQRSRDRDRDAGLEREREWGAERSGSRDRDLDREWFDDRERSREREFGNERMRSRSYRSRQDQDRAAFSSHDEIDRAYKSRDPSFTPSPLARERSVEERGGKKSTTEKRSKKSSTTASVRRRQKSDSDVSALKKTPKKSVAGSTALKRDEQELIDLPAEVEDDDSDDVDAGNDASFTMLAERYSEQRISSKKTRSKPGSSKSKAMAKVGHEQPSSAPGNPAAGNSSQAIPPMPSMAGNPAAFYQSTPGMGYNPMMMMPNPYAMYGSVNPVAMADPMAMYSAYQTVNPAMYYASMNPGIVPSHSMPVMPGLQSPGAQSTPAAHSPAIQATPVQSPPQTIGPQSTQVGQTSNQTAPAQPPLPNAGAGSLQAPAQQQVSVSPAAAPISSATLPQMSSFYNSVPGINPMMNPSTMPGMPFMMPSGQMPPAQIPPAQIAPVGGGDGMGTKNFGAQPNMSLGSAEAQAAVYQNAMQQAAVAYHSAANAYRTIHGQAPIEAPAAGSLPPPSASTEAPATASQTEGQ
eukprot:GFKZ01007878.1.p1 GENE.GFKZ01007878.1~~GFKZ01007878.1.p1  ORF type:complete len:1000 (+),score=161.24 GFKZ01007878.1:123-3002(+)